MNKLKTGCLLFLQNLWFLILVYLFSNQAFHLRGQRKTVLCTIFVLNLFRYYCFKHLPKNENSFLSTVSFVSSEITGKFVSARYLLNWLMIITWQKRMFKFAKVKAHFIFGLNAGFCVRSVSPELKLLRKNVNRTEMLCIMQPTVSVSPSFSNVVSSL